MSSDNNLEVPLALVPRSPMCHPYFVGVPAGGYGDPYVGYPYPGGLPAPQGAYPAVLMMPQASAMTSPTAEDGGDGAGGASGTAVKNVPPERYRSEREEKMRGGLTWTKTPAVVVMEHPSLRQLVILMAVLFLLALVAVIITSIYIGRIAETPWNA